MKLSQEQTEGKLPEPGGCVLMGRRAGEETGHFWAIASCPRRAPPTHHRRGGQHWAGKMGTRRLPSLQLAYLR